MKVAVYFGAGRVKVAVGWGIKSDNDYRYNRLKKFLYLQKNIANKFANHENIVYLCGYKKSETRKPHFKCFHNGIILIVSSIKFYGAKIDTFFEITKQNLIKFLIKEITL